MEDVLAALGGDPRKVRLLEWLITLPAEREPRSKAGLAEELGVAPRTLRDWQGTDVFRKLHEREASRLSGGPEKTQAILAKLESYALDDQRRDSVSAAKLWLEATGAIAPKGVKPSEASGLAASKGVRELTEEELDRILAERFGAPSGA